MTLMPGFPVAPPSFSEHPLRGPGHARVSRFVVASRLLDRPTILPRRLTTPNENPIYWRFTGGSRLDSVL